MGSDLPSRVVKGVSQSIFFIKAARLNNTGRSLPNLDTNGFQKYLRKK
jgi:hypothetical protein